MELTEHVAGLVRNLMDSAGLVNEDERRIAQQLVRQAEASIRLTLQDVLADAADEITTQIAPGSVELRLRGRELGFVVTPPEAAAPPLPPPPPPPPNGSAGEQDGVTARMTFRPSEQLKARIERAAEAEGLSVNGYLVRTMSGLLDVAAQATGRAGSSLGGRYRGWVS